MADRDPRTAQAAPVSAALLNLIRLKFPGTLRLAADGTFFWRRADGTELHLREKGQADP
jgi:hypothetical protein